jgi:hypothetical protein
VIRLGDAAFYLIASLGGLAGAAIIAGFALGVVAQWANAQWLDRAWVKATGMVVGVGVAALGFALAGAVRNRLL